MKKVLVVDDDVFILESIEFIMEFNGLICDVVSGVYEALDKLSVLSQYSCIVLDIMMRKPVGLKIPLDEEAGEFIAKKILKMDPEFPIVILSAKNPDRINLPFERKNIRYVSKPIGRTADALVCSIREIACE